MEAAGGLAGARRARHHHIFFRDDASQNRPRVVDAALRHSHVFRIRSLNITRRRTHQSSVADRRPRQHSRISVALSMYYLHSESKSKRKLPQCICLGGMGNGNHEATPAHVA
jgi:hypothetical protein